MSREAIIIGGPNGAGKSTLAYEYQKTYNFPYLSADLIAAQLSPPKPELARIQAGKVFFERIQALIQQGQSFLVESTLAGRGIGRIFQQLNRAGYSTRIAYVFLDTPELCIRRIHERVQQGGHDVPPTDVTRRYYRSKKNFWTVYREQVARWYLFYNAGESFQEVAVGQAGSYSITDEALFDLFMKDLRT